MGSRILSAASAALLALVPAIACNGASAGNNAEKQPSAHSNAPSADSAPVAVVLESTAAGAGDAPAAEMRPASATQVTDSRSANAQGRIPILEYHLVGDQDGRWERKRESFRRDLEVLYERGYRPITVSQLVDGRIDLPAGLSPVVFTFDDASPSQFRYADRSGNLVVDPGSALGIWLDFRKEHPDWENRATFCMLSGAEAGRSFFGNKGIEGQQTEWRFRKVRFLVDSGFELCNHTLWHANLSKYDDATVMEQIARLNMAIDSAVPGYKVRTFALPLGEWPKNRGVAKAGAWKDPKSGRTVAYDFDAILLVSGGPARSPSDPQFDPLRLTRVQVLGDELTKTLDQLDKAGTRYVSAGKNRQRAVGDR